MMTYKMSYNSISGLFCFDLAYSNGNNPLADHTWMGLNGGNEWT